MATPAAHEWWNFLILAETPAETEEADFWLADLDADKARLEKGPPPEAERLVFLQKKRLSISNTMRRDPGAVGRWQNAQFFMQRWLEEERPVNLALLQEFHALVSSCEPGQWRCAPVFTTQIEHVAAGELPALMERVEAYLLELQPHCHPVRLACLWRYFILSIHPFLDGNGRSSQLLSDYILLGAGYPPQVFFSLMDAYIVGHPTIKSHATAHYALRGLYRSLKNAFALLLNHDHP